MKKEKSSQHEENELTREILDSISAVVFLWKNTGNWPVEHVSANVTTLFGYSPDDFYSGKLTYADLIHPQDIDRVKKEVAENSADLSKSQFRHEPYRIVSKTGEVIWLDDHTSIRRNEEGVITHYQGIVVNITERKNIENELRKSNEKYSAIFNHSFNGNYLHDYDGRVIEVNDVACEQSGYSREEILQRSIFDNHPKTQDTLNLPKNDIINMWKQWPVGHRNVIQAEHERKDGTIYPVEIITGPIEYGDQVLLLAIVQDITERKKSEQMLADEKERLSVTLQSIGDGVITTDTNGTIVMLNKAAEQMTGWSSGEAAGRPLEEVFNIINEYTRMQCENPVARVLATGSIVELANHTVLVARNNHEIAISDSAAPIKNAKNETIGVVLVFRDMTEKKKLERALEVSSKLESLGVLAGGIAHDFNNLLAGIYGNIDLALESAADETTSEYLSKTISTLDRARALTQQLLTFAKGGAPVKKIAPLFPLVRETVQFALSGSNVSCDFDIQQDLWNGNYDKNQVCQVIDNIVINAQQAMPVGGKILVSARNSSLAEKEHPLLAKGDYVKIAIKDSGVGIPNELLNRIFDPFFTTKTKGHGLGLATCYSIINRHGGCIDVSSKTGNGTVFTVYLPAADNAATSFGKQSSARHTGSGTFLVMDDEENIRDILKNVLESFGYRVVCKENGKEALDFLAAESEANRSVSGMIFDLTIPGGMGGMEAIAKLRKTDTETPVFVASGYADGPVMKNPVEYGFTAGICKPFIKSELMEMLEKHMKQQA